MDIQNILEQAKQRGLSAIDSIKKSVTPVSTPKTQVTAPQPAIFTKLISSPIKPAYTDIKSVISTTFLAKPDVIKPVEIKPIQITPAQPKTFELPKPSEYLFGDIAKDVNKRIEFQYNKVTSDFNNYLKNNLAPVVRNYVDTINRTGPEISQLDIALAPPKKRQELITKLGEQQKALGQLQAETGLTTLYAINIPSNIFNKSIIQPSYQQFQLSERQRQTGQIPTQEELNLANQGELNKTTNELVGRKLMDIPSKMDLGLLQQALNNNSAFYLSEVRDTVVSLIDYDTLLAGTGLATLGIKKGLNKLPSNVADNLSVKEARLTQAVIENDIPKIEKEIGKPLNETQITKIEEINKIPINEDIKTRIIETKTKPFDFKTQIEEFNNTARQKFKTLTETKQPKENLPTDWIRNYNQARKLEREAAVGVKTLKDNTETFWYGLVNSLYSRRAIVYDTVNKLVKSGVNLLPTKDPRMLALKMNNSSLQTDLILKDMGYWNTIDEAVKANTGILKKGEVVDDFGNFLAAKRKVTLHEKGIQLDPNYTEDAKFVSYNSDKYKVAGTMFNDFTNNFLNLLEKDGLIDSFRASQLRLNEDYAPFRVLTNDMLEKRKIKLMETKTDVAKDKVVQYLQDFNTNIVANPLETMQSMVALYVQEKARNEYAKSFGELVREGLIEDAFIIRDAKNVKMREYYNSTIQNLKDTTEKLQKIYDRDNKKAKILYKEVNNLNKKGYDLVSFRKDTEEESRFAQKITNAIERRLDKKDELIKEINQNFQGILNIKQAGEEVLKDTKFINRTNRMIDTRKEWIEGMVDIGADMLSKKGKKFVENKGVKFPNKAQRKQFLLNASQQDVSNFIQDIFDLPKKQFDILLNKATTNKLKIENVLKEIETIKNTQFVNTAVNSLIKLPKPEIDNIYSKIQNKQSQVGKLMTEIKKLSDNRVYNNVVNSLIKNTPDELLNIQRQLERKYPVLNEMIDSILEQQNKIDVNTGVIKSLQEEEKLIQDLPKRGLTTISWLKDGVTEIAAIPKRLEAGFLDDQSMSSLYNSWVFKGLENFTRGFKTVLTTVNPKSKIKQIQKQASQIGTLADKDVIPQALNPVGFATAMRDSWVQSPEFKKFVEAGGGFSQFNFAKSQEDLTRYGQKGGKVSKLSLSNWEEVLGMDEVASRFQLQQAYKKKYLKEGLSDVDATLKATYEVNNILPNYGETGIYTRLIEGLYPYFRINLQSATNVGKQFVKNPTGTAFKIGLRVGIPAIVATAFNNATPAQREAYNDLTEDQKSRGLIIVPLNPKKGEDGKWQVYEYPVEEVVMNFYNPYRRAIEKSINVGENWAMSFANEFLSPQSLSNFFQGSTGVNIPTSGEAVRKNIIGQANPLLRMPVELTFNKVGYTGQPIIPRALENINEPFMQYDNKTSPLAKDLGYKLNYSPKQIDYLMNNLSVGALDFAEMGINQALYEAENSDVKKVTQKNPVQELIDTILFIKKGGGAEAQKTYQQVKEMDSQTAITNKVALELLQKNDIAGLKDLVNNGQITKEQFKGIENAYQKEQLTKDLTSTQKALYNQSAGVLQKLSEKSPELSNDINIVKELKAQESKLPNINTTGFNFAPSPTKTGTGGLKLGKPKGLSLKVSRKGTGIRAPKAPRAIAPKKITIKKPKKIKQVKLPKIKPLKKVKRF